ncbi:UDP-glucose dehydrogenase family protein [Noviherbaspirillum aridicola]|uniref:UDP-glucose 6-dehydrogenase n=1 Tax=Noviherbaspirillum aridicola TaxID=2849687 RepID=A0ABQ4Q6L1_9BURK|nr:UDP-glucose/GDP-mannose dehydrogenase family protein [Noviherbaspirillum aridicola]GIZ52857.1 UDP-glucose 6-dehydrogenase [Noviherbaspirillum aridicola]
MNITVIGTGYVGLVTGTCLAEVGNDVLCLDVDTAKIAMLNDGRIPIYEPGLEQIAARNVAAGRLRFTSDQREAVRFGAVQFIAVGTPPGEDGSADLQYVLAAARNIGRHMDSRTIVVNKSTVPVGTADAVDAVIREELARRGADVDFAVVSNPEFLKEGAAVEDFMRPDRVIIGADDPQAIACLRSIYSAFVRNHDRLMVMDTRSAELTKYASNAMLATRISFMNELANLADKVGADIERVRVGIGSDPRIGFDFLYAGCGYGGSCFPKDVRALLRTAGDNGVRLGVLEAVDDANEAQKRLLLDKIKARFGNDLKGRRFAMWGLAFKANTNDMRAATSRVVIKGLFDAGARVVGYDPVAMPEARRLFRNDDRLSLADSAMDALRGADALVIVTEWKEFRSPNHAMVRELLRHPVIFDGRNLYDPESVRGYGLEYIGIGRR